MKAREVVLYGTAMGILLWAVTVLVLPGPKA